MSIWIIHCLQCHQLWCRCQIRTTSWIVILYYFEKLRTSIIQLAMYHVSRVLDRQLLNRWCHRHENCRLCSRPHSHESLIFSYFFGFMKLNFACKSCGRSWVARVEPCHWSEGRHNYVGVSLQERHATMQIMLGLSQRASLVIFVSFLFCILLSLNSSANCIAGAQWIKVHQIYCYHTLMYNITYTSMMHNQLKHDTARCRLICTCLVCILNVGQIVWHGTEHLWVDDIPLSCIGDIIDCVIGVY